MKLARKNMKKNKIQNYFQIINNFKKVIIIMIAIKNVFINNLLIQMIHNILVMQQIVKNNSNCQINYPKKNQKKSKSLRY